MVNHVEEERGHPDRSLVVRLASKLTHRVLKRERTSVRAQAKYLTIENQGVGWQGSDDLHDILHAVGHFVEVARERLDDLTRLVNLQTGPVEFPFDRNGGLITDRTLPGFGNGLVGLGQHGLNGTQYLQANRLQPGPSLRQSDSGRDP